MNSDNAPAMTPSDLDREIFNVARQRFTVRELRDRASLIEPRIILLREINDGTVETLDAIGTKIDELAHGLQAFTIIVDLADATGATTPEYRKYVPQFFINIHAKTRGALKAVPVIFHGNPLTRVVTRFFMGRIKEFPMTVHKSHQLALEAARAVIAK